jgi:hypothetical protein
LHKIMLDQCTFVKGCGLRFGAVDSPAAKVMHSRITRYLALKAAVH